MEIIQKKIKDIIPYENNPRNNDEAVKYVAESIKEFGFKNPIIIDKDNVVIAGHTRLKSAKKLGLKQVPCIIADDLNEEQVKAFRLADNKVSERASWDESLLQVELEGIFDIDMEALGFELDFEEEEPKEKTNARERTYKKDNFDQYDETRVEGFYDMPKLEATKHIPTGLIAFNNFLTSTEYENGIHFYKDDYRFERIWERPEYYIEKMTQFDCALTPDFSLYTDMPMAQKVWNVYRSRLIGQIMQDYGMEVIPTLQWAEEETFQFCFDGLPQDGVVSVSTIGVKLDEDKTNIWKNGMDEAIRRLNPRAIVVYGGDIGYNFGDIQTVYFENSIK